MYVSPVEPLAFELGQTTNTPRTQSLLRLATVTDFSRDSLDSQLNLVKISFLPPVPVKILCKHCTQESPFVFRDP